MSPTRYLPVETTSFVGRVRELGEIEKALADSRLVTLTGVGGVGKSRLAARAAARVAPALADGARFVALAPLRDASLLGHVLLEDLRLADQHSRSPEELVAEWLADKELLLVLDSCEHLVEACSRLVRTLLNAAPGVRILTTSRQGLAVPGELGFAVDPLPVPEPTTDGDAPAAGDAVALFAERAAEAVPDFNLVGTDRMAAAAVCRRLDGIPLAVELAAAQLAELPDHSVYELNDRLQHRFETLVAQSGKAGRALPRHRTLRTTIGWSHELCAPLERLLWARLSVCTGGFDLAGAQAIGCGGPLAVERVAEVLAGLVTKSLVRKHPDGLGGERYSMLDTVREFGAHWLYELGEETETQLRHRDFYRDLACRADAEWVGPDQVSWYTRLIADRANFRTALRFCLAQGEGRTALEIGGALWMMWAGFGHTREGAHYLELALDLCREPSPERAKALWARAYVATALGDVTVAERFSAELGHCYDATGDEVARFAAAHMRTGGLVLRSEHEQAAAESTATLSRPLPHGVFPVPSVPWYMLRVTHSYAHFCSGDVATAEARASEITEECERLGELWIRGFAYYVRALAALSLGRITEARAHARTVIAHKSLFHDSLNVVMAVEALATATTATGRTERAARLLGIGQRIWQTLGRPHLGSPQMAAAHTATEHQIRTAIGDATYETEYAAGRAMSPDDGIAYCLTPDRPPLPAHSPPAAA
ncbi:ATP-binding protein [Streptomyces sp. NPDC102384]|uniref:ATP-binding protein n=1 Tax=Streptomyces sp. NPDC102384 TaxID=3366166 RepID=UPI0038051D10